MCQRRQAACAPPSVLGFVEGPFTGGPLASGCCASFIFHVSYMARNHKQKKSSKLYKTLTGEVRRGLKVGTFFLLVAAEPFLIVVVALSSRGVRTTARA